MLKLTFCFAVFLIFFESIDSKTLKVKFSTTKSKKHGGQIISSFTYSTGAGILSYKLYHQPTIQPKLFIFPYDTFYPLKARYVKPTRDQCTEYFSKSMDVVTIVNASASFTIGKFSGAFPIVLVYADYFTCQIYPTDIQVKNSNFDILFGKHTEVLGNGNENLECELQLLNTDEEGGPPTHLSAEEMGLVGSFQIIVLLYVLALCVWLPKLMKQLFEPGAIQTVLRLVTLVTIIQLTTNLMYLWHIYRYSIDGIGRSIYELLAELLEIGSHYLLLVLIISWTLSGKQEGKLDWCGNTVIFVIVMAAIEMIVFIWREGSPVNPDQWNRDTQVFRNGFGFGGPKDNWIGVSLLLLRIAIACLFALHLLKLAKGEKSCVRREFFSTFSLICLVWFLSFPVVYVVGLLCADYVRYKFVTICVSLCQAGSLALFYQLLISRNQIWELSSISSSLPMVMRQTK